MNTKIQAKYNGDKHDYIIYFINDELVAFQCECDLFYHQDRVNENQLIELKQIALAIWDSEELDVIAGFSENGFKEYLPSNLEKYSKELIKCSSCNEWFEESQINQGLTYDENENYCEQCTSELFPSDDEDDEDEALKEMETKAGYYD